MVVMKAVLRFFRHFGWYTIGHGMEKCAFTGIVRVKYQPTHPQKISSAKGNEER